MPILDWLLWAPCKTVCPSGLRGWTQAPLARAAWAQIPQVSSLQRPCGQQCRTVARVAKGFCGCRRPVCHQTSSAPFQVASLAACQQQFRGRGLADRQGHFAPSGLRGWTQVPLAQAARVQVPQLSFISRSIRAHMRRCALKLRNRHTGQLASWESGYKLTETTSGSCCMF